MKALSLTRPWPYAILHLGKGLENRSDKRGMPPMCKHRGWLLIHASKGWDKEAGPFLAKKRIHPIPDTIFRKKEHQTGIVGRCRVVGHVEPVGIFDHTMVEGVVGDRRERRHGVWWCNGRRLDERWWMGGYALVLDDVEALPEPIPCNGRLGLWTPPDDVLKQLPAGWRAEVSQS
jgi:hypothetical protein